MKQLHGGDLTTFRQQYPGKPVWDFSANINPLGLPEGVRRALAASAEDCAHYPDPDCRALRRALSRFEGVAEHRILCGNGVADLIYRIALALRPARAVVPSPTFVEYERALRAAGCAVAFPLLSEPDGFAPGPSLLEQVESAGILFLCNPNNPTGLLADPALLDRLLHRCAQCGTVLVVDECFLEFAGDAHLHTMKRHLESAPHLLILRAFTKLFAMPGLRLGYLLGGDAALLARIRDAGPPWGVSVPAQRCGVAAVEETRYLADTRRELPRLRAQLADGLAELGLEVLPGQANFLLFRGPTGLADALYPQGILLRDCAAMRGLSPGWYRAAVRTAEENALLVAALRECMAR